MKKILFILLAASVYFSSCTYYGHDGLDGEAFLKINYGNGEPSYVDAGGAIPNNFYWDTFYRTYPGFYTVNFEYTFPGPYGDRIYPYQVEIEVWNYLGEEGGQNYSGDDGDDTYFDLTLYSDGFIEYTHDVYVKSEELSKELPKDVTEKTLIGSNQQVKNGKGIKYTYYQLPSRLLEK